MRILILDSYYPAFLNSFYGRRPELAARPYEEQWRALMDECFGTADFYSSNLKALGHEAREVVANCEPLQRRWAAEHGVRLEKGEWGWSRRAGLIPWPRRVGPGEWFYAVLAAQVKQYRPDVLHLQDMNGISPAFLREVRPYARLITGQIACPVAEGADFRGYDLVLSSFPHFVERFRSEGLRSAYFNLGFEPKVLEKLRGQASYGVVFVGGLSAVHGGRLRLLEAVNSSTRLDVWGYGADALGAGSPLRAVHHGDAWGLRMYEILRGARVALNQHIGVAEGYANNMRLYEATGVGTLLLTDYKSNLADLFEPGREVVAYRSTEECVELIDYYLSHEEERAAIARAGQARTLREHTYRHRMQELLELVGRYL